MLLCSRTGARHGPGRTVRETGGEEAPQSLVRSGTDPAPPAREDRAAMIELVLTVCLVASPGACRDERPEFGATSLMGCVVQGQALAARWLEDHPHFTLSRWRCESNIPRQARI